LQPAGLSSARPPRATQNDVVSAQLDTEPSSDGFDRVLECIVGERLDLAGLLVDEMVVVAVGIGDLEPRHAVTTVEAMQQAELEQLVDHPVHRGRRCGSLGAKTIGDLLRAQQALSLASEELDDGGTSGTGAQAGTGRELLSMDEPTIAKLRVHKPEPSAR
jgi:hypothetical protein